MSESAHEFREGQQVRLLRELRGHPKGTVGRVEEAGPSMLLVKVGDELVNVHHADVEAES